MVKLKNDWAELLAGQFEEPYYQNLRSFLKTEYSTRRIYPDMYDIFNAFHYTAYKDVKAVILGQDPYHGAGQAHGLCFSVKKGVAPPPSLLNIFKELQSDLGVPPASHGELTKWAESGVMLLNATLTVREGAANSHRNKGWEIFTDYAIGLLNKREEPIVFILWGRDARAKAALIDSDRHLILQSAHPSPLSAHYGFFGNGHFSKTNGYLVSAGREPVDWSL
jgi:uracil-DNA glycosylase